MMLARLQSSVRFISLASSSVLAIGLSLSACGSNDGSSDEGGSAGANSRMDGSGSSDAEAADSGSDKPNIRLEPTYEFTVSTLTYGQGQVRDDWNGKLLDTVDLELDLYEPVDAPAGRPALIHVHGGGFIGGSKTAASAVEFMEFFASRGWVTASISYRLASQYGDVPPEWFNVVAAGMTASSKQFNQGMAMYPAARDAKAAVRWLVANASTYQIDTDYISVSGGSAGSYLAVMLGTTDAADFRDEIDATIDPTLDSTNLSASPKVHTVIDHWGGVTMLEILELIDGVSRYDASDAPVSIVHGTEDQIVPFEEAEKLRAGYEQSGVPYLFYPLEGAGHGPWNATVEEKNLRELAFDFIVKQQQLDPQ